MPYGSIPPPKKPRKKVIENKLKKKPFPKGGLSDSQEKALKAHSKKHSKGHIQYMTKLMMGGMSFSASHKKAMTDKGK